MSRVLVAVSFYDADDHLSEVSWISNTHYSGVYGLLKLIIPKIIQHTVTKRIIVIDTDLIFLDDIAKLWKLFDSFNHSQVSSKFLYTPDIICRQLGQWMPI